MGRAIQFKTGQEGEIFIKWLESRLIRNNKNVLGAELGATGSGKSYRDLRKAELWYQHHFKEPFPVENICFGVPSAMKLLASHKLRRGEIIIFEEAGANLGSLDFQQRISKMMTYVLQSFRSMNIGIFFNLPYLSMLNKQARLLMHYSFESAGIDFKTKINKCKPKFHQVNQSTGKIYQKYPIIKVGGTTKKVKRFAFSMPSAYLTEAYEQKKNKYLKELTESYDKELDKLSGKVKVEMPDDIELEWYYKNKKEKISMEKIAKEEEKGLTTVWRAIKKVENWKKLRENKGNNTTLTEDSFQTPLIQQNNLSI